MTRSVFILIRAIVYAVIFVGVLLVDVPSRLLNAASIARPTGIGAAQIAGMIITTAGAAVALWCLFTFVFVGKGTAAPFDPPRLVVRGPYRFVRNPMYISAILAMLGLALFYRSLSILIYAGVIFLATHLLVVAYEEPTLRRTFRSDYEVYCRRVNRWWPCGRDD
jgi:protein-S-isoprenylcysteine O-methyltransferase Ste14